MVCQRRWGKDSRLNESKLIWTAAVCVVSVCVRPMCVIIMVDLPVGLLYTMKMFVLIHILYTKFVEMSMLILQKKFSCLLTQTICSTRSHQRWPENLQPLGSDFHQNSEYWMSTGRATQRIANVLHKRTTVLWTVEPPQITCGAPRSQASDSHHPSHQFCVVLCFSERKGLVS